MSTNCIHIKGARVHNLKNIDVTIPRDKLVVLTGLSGSGKSSLAFDTIYAEGQRRYVESLSSYARQFLQIQDKPDVDLIEGLSPAISIEQKTTNKNPRSTVATVTEIYDYLRLLFARIGRPFCYSCHKPIEGRSATQIIDEIQGYKSSTKISILAPIIRKRKGENKKLFEELIKEGFIRVRVDGENRLLEEDIKLNAKQKHTIEVVIDRLVTSSDSRMRVADAVELALKKADGLVNILTHLPGQKFKEELFSQNFACIDCKISYPEIEPRLFSFNGPTGACSTCNGLGNFLSFDENLIVPNKSLSLEKGSVLPWSGTAGGYYQQMLFHVADFLGFDVNTPFGKLKKSEREAIFYGTSKPINFSLSGKYGRGHKFTRKFEGVINNLNRRYHETESNYIREDLQQYMTSSLCPECAGARLKKEVLSIKVANLSIAEVVDMSIKEALGLFSKIKLEGVHKKIGTPILREIYSRLDFLLAVGLEYLTLNRAARTLSNGETQRIRLATQIGSALVGVLYVLDEPSIGLHQRDNAKLLDTLKKLRDLGNTVLVVEHDEKTIMAADHIIDMGPMAGRLGGKIIASGKPADILKHKGSLTGQYISRKMRIEIPTERRAGNGKFLSLLGAKGNNLQNLDVQFPLGKFICVTGVSGSGKSSLIVDTLHKAVAQAVYDTEEKPLAFDEIEGLDNIDKIIDIDQSPIGRTPRSNPATYTGVFDPIRQIFAELPEAKIRGFKAGRFSFNVKGGRCEACRGGGINRIEMNFLADVYVTCEECKGKRFNHDTLAILYKGKSISDVLEMTVEQARKFFSAILNISRKLATLQKVGLGYIHLGQQATTLSGGEAQRIKLSRELSKRFTGKTLYILDEPTTGLHFHDTSHLLKVLHFLADQGNTVIVIEHNLDVLKVCDHIIDLGPEGGYGGGNIVVQGSPEKVAKHKKSYTGQFLKQTYNSDGHKLGKTSFKQVSPPESLDKIRGRKAKKERISKMKKLSRG